MHLCPCFWQEVLFHIFAHCFLVWLYPPEYLIGNPIFGQRMILSFDAKWEFMQMLVFDQLAQFVLVYLLCSGLLQVNFDREFMKSASIMPQYVTHCNVSLTILCKLWPVITNSILVVKTTLVYHHCNKNGAYAFSRTKDARKSFSIVSLIVRNSV